MMVFILKGLIRDRSRSLFPLTVIALGVAVTVILHAWLGGILDDMIKANASYRTGHVKITTRAYAEQADQAPTDLALFQVGELITRLNEQFPDCWWLPRTRFGGLLDIPNIRGETLAQGPVVALAVSLLEEQSPELETLNLETALVRGSMPRNPGEILVSEALAAKMGLRLGETATFIGSTAFGSMTTYNFTFTGSIRFGVEAMDRGAIILDIEDARNLLDLEDASAEILGLFKDDRYRPKRADAIKDAFNAQYGESDDPFSPVMAGIRDQKGLAGMLQALNARLSMVVGLFVFVMFIILWNAGLMGSLRRYGEIGVRLALGEEKKRLYGTLLLEALIIGLVGSALGTVLGLSAGFYLQKYGIDVGTMMQNASAMMPNVMRARVTSQSYLIGFLPGVVATLLGAAVSGAGIFKRDTSQLFKELEV